MRISDWSSDVCSSDLDHKVNTIAIGDLVSPWLDRAVLNRMHQYAARRELAYLFQQLGIAGDGQDLGHSHGQRQEDGTKPQSPRSAIDEGRAIGASAALAQRGLDRKRTRLNSSHSCADRKQSS